MMVTWTRAQVEKSDHILDTFRKLMDFLVNWIQSMKELVNKRAAQDEIPGKESLQEGHKFRGGYGPWVATF